MRHSQRSWWFLIIIVLVFLLLLSACNYRRGWVEVTYRDRTRATYTTFDGQHGTTLELAAGDAVVVDYELEVTKGCLSLQILDPGRGVIWEENFHENNSGDFSFTAEIKGTYRLVMVGDETGGGFDLSWNISASD